MRHFLGLGKKLGLVLLASSAFGQPVHAQEAPASKDTTFWIATSHSKMKYDKPGFAFESSGWVTTLGLDRSLNEQWLVGATLSGKRTVSTSDAISNRSEHRGVTPGINAIWTDTRGFFVNGSAEYGRTSSDNTRLRNGRSAYHESNQDELSTKLGATQYFWLMPGLRSSVGLSHARYFTSDRRYIDASGTSVVGEKRNWGLTSIETGLSYPLGDFTPHVSGDFNRSTTPILGGSGKSSFFGYQIGASYRAFENARLNFNYAGQAGIANFTSRRFGVSLGYEF